MKEKIAPYLPGIGLFLVTLILGLIIYKDYGMGWDEPLQRGPALLSWDYVFHGKMDLFTTETDNHGAGFEMVLLAFEKGMNLTDTRDIYLMRHIVTHVLFLLSSFAGYVLVYRMFRDKWIASLGFLMFTFAPRIYAHSYFNSKDLPFLCMVLIGLAFTQLAFDKKKWWWFVLAGMAFGYGTGIRVMGIFYLLLVGLLLLIDLITQLKEKQKPVNPIVQMVLFTLGFSFILYLSWPYLWRDPVGKFKESFGALAHFKFQGSVFFQGQFTPAPDLPWTYIPTWFIISTPILWLVAGAAGLILLIAGFVRNPKAYLVNGNDRNLLFYALCFAGPVLAIIVMHSVVYDDWRHLYFVYPPFVLVGLYAINRLYVMNKMKWVALGICGAQLLVVANFMVLNHPNQQVYFNSLVKQDDEYLRSQYELDYWGCSFRQALEQLAEADNSPVIKVSGNWAFPLNNNIMILPKELRKRFVLENDPQKSDYFLTNFRLHPGDAGYPAANYIQYELSICHSTVMRVYKVKGLVQQTQAPAPAPAPVQPMQ